jgi:peroxiredoxin
MSRRFNMADVRTVLETRAIALENGHSAPDFILKNQEGRDFKLSDLRGKRILLSFHPLAWTDICAKQMLSLENNVEIFEKLNTVPVGLSVDSIPCKKAWADHLGIKRVSLLSDFWPHGRVASLYGMFREKEGTARRVNVVVGEEGKIKLTKVYQISELPDIKEIIDLISALR